MDVCIYLCIYVIICQHHSAEKCCESKDVQSADGIGNNSEEKKSSSWIDYFRFTFQPCVVTTCYKIYIASQIICFYSCFAATHSIVCGKWVKTASIVCGPSCFRAIITRIIEETMTQWQILEEDEPLLQCIIWRVCGGSGMSAGGGFCCSNYVNIVSVGSAAAVVMWERF